MKTNLSSPRILFVVFLVTVSLLTGAAYAASPSSGTVSQSATQASWTGGPGLPTASATCGGPSNTACDNYKLNVVPPSYAFKIEITLTPKPTDDYDLEVYGPDGALVGSSGNSAGGAEKVTLNNPAAGVYTVSAANFAAILAYSANAKLSQLPAQPGTSTEKPPVYTTYNPTGGLGESAGEPTLGVNENTGAVMYIAFTETLKADFDDCSSPASATWNDVSATLTSLESFDPILFTDQKTGRTFVSQLLPTKISLMAYTDDDGETWQPSQGAGINSGVDHQSVGGGPFALGPLGPLTSYPNIVYYCSQDIALAQCATSLDGGRTFGVAVPIYNLTQCNGLHGHVKVGPDGTAFVPNKNCGGEQGLAISRDNGLTWGVVHVPGSTAGETDPSVGIATDGTVYFGWSNGDGHAYTAVSKDGGRTWGHIQDVGKSFGIKNSVFPVMVAGDGNRAAFAFLGTTTAGAEVYGEDPDLPAVWHLYVAHTYDGGATWVTVNATPGDPVQRGTVCTAGTTCGGTRNLLDFMDVTADAKGRVLVGYADGCIGDCVNGGPNSGTDLAAIARQTTGKGLYAQFDQPLSVPASPLVSGSITGGVAHVTWSTPDDRGTPITGYRIYRSQGGGVFEQIQGVAATVHAFDNPVPAGSTYSYKVTAVNAQGEGVACRDVSLSN
ncbi:MAG TPA: fibronectin type III domain-containing protein [Thermoanaerobaculia bacterium]|nr:fibronectin type III domain-containing protein [Thermoanaerobaculia bacterium]